MPTTVWIASLERTGGAADAFACWLTPAEAQRADAFLHDIDRRRFTLGRALARCAAARTLGGDARTIEIALEHSGRPRLAPGAPALGIAHGGDLVIVALATDAQVGVDVEPLARAGEIASLAPLVCSASEAQAVDALAAAARPRRLLSLWTLKEACLKATGAGLAVDPREVVFDFDARERPVLVQAPHTHPDALRGSWRFTLRPDDAGHVIALAVHGIARDATAPLFADASALLARRLAPE